MIRTAFVLGAGLGTRLRPLTSRRPKPLIPVVNRPLITYAFDHLLGIGVERLVVNTHWRSAAYAAEFSEGQYGGAPLLFRDEQPSILETGGGIWNVRDLLGAAPFIVYNGDILSDLPLDPAFDAHRRGEHEVTLILRSAGGPLQVAFDATSGLVTDIGGQVSPVLEPRFLFTGIYVVEPAFIARIPPAEKISVVPIFCAMIREQARLGAVVIDAGSWKDLGSREQYLEVHRDLAARPDSADLCWKAPSARISTSAKLRGSTTVGRGAVIGENAWLRDCIIWDHAEVAPDAFLERCIVTDHACAIGTHDNVDFSPAG